MHAAPIRETAEVAEGPKARVGAVVESELAIAAARVGEAHVIAEVVEVTLWAEEGEVLRDGVGQRSGVAEGFLKVLA